MAEPDQTTIGVVISTQDLNPGVIDAYRNNIQAFGRDTVAQAEKGGTALKGFGFATKEVAHQLGVTGPMARMFGHEAIYMAESLGAAGSMIGVATIATLAGYKVYEHFAESSKKLSEETLKGADASMAWVEAARVSTIETNALREAKDRLWSVEKEINIQNLKNGIKAQMDLISKQAEDVGKLGARAQVDTFGWQGSIMTRLIYGTKEERTAAFNDLDIDSQRNIAKLQIMYADLEIAKGKGTLARKKPEDEPWSAAYTAMVGANIHEVMQMEEEYQNFVVAQNVQEWDDMESARQQRLKDLDTTRAILSKRTEYTQKANEKEVADTLRAEEMKRQSVHSTASFFSQALDTMASLGGKNARKYFEMHKVAATAEAIISTYQGAAKALGQGGAYGYVLAAAVIAAGLANVAKIQSQTFDGGASSGGGGGYSGGGYSSTASSDSGGNYKYFNYEQSQYGSGWRPGEVHNGPTIIVQGDVYAQDGDQFQKKVSEAWNKSVQYNEHGVQDKGRKYIRR